MSESSKPRGRTAVLKSPKTKVKARSVELKSVKREYAKPAQEKSKEVIATCTAEIESLEKLLQTITNEETRRVTKDKIRKVKDERKKANAKIRRCRSFVKASKK